MNIVLVGHTGFVGKSILNANCFKNDNFILIGRAELTKDQFCNDFYSADVLIYTAGIAHDISGKIKEQDYYDVNVELLKKVYDHYLKSNIKSFIYFSSIKAVTDKSESIITEDTKPQPKTIYGITKLIAEKYIQERTVYGKTYYILRPTMIHGPGNKGNLNVLYKYLNSGSPWILGSFKNERSFASISNVLFVLNILARTQKVPEGVYNVCDDNAVSMNRIVDLFEIACNKKIVKLYFGKRIFNAAARVGDLLRLRINSLFLEKITETFLVSNIKIRKFIETDLPLTSEEGLIMTFKNMSNNK